MFEPSLRAVFAKQPASSFCTAHNVQAVFNDNSFRFLSDIDLSYTLHPSRTHLAIDGSAQANYNFRQSFDVYQSSIKTDRISIVVL